MYLKYLDLIGFKSFADKTRLEFEPGITGVVGPNGCGKSNVIDALRWCLGEMSAKSLRSSVLLDVIFSGTGSRGPQNMAEVSLTFDNTDHLLPIDYSEVTVSRRLYRSGESEYFINKTQCRLKDIRELFLDTGMGEDGYSVMEQGRVEYILQAKPEDRRELFEEAAGVAKYKARRDEAQRKLERVDIDLSRLADIISMTKDQMDKLEASVKKAQTYQRLEQELKVLELQDLLFQAQALREHLTTLETRFKSAEENVQVLTTRVHAGEARLQERRLELTQKQEELSGAGTRKAALEGDMKLCEERLKNASQRQTELESRRAALLEESSRSRSQLEDLLKQQETLAHAKAGSESSYDALKTVVDEAEKSFQTVHDELVRQEQVLAQLKDDLFGCNASKAQLTQTLHQFRTQATRTEYELQNLYKDRTKSQGKIEELKTQGETYAGQEEQLNRERAECETERNRVQKEIQSLGVDERHAQDSRRKAAEKIMEINGRLMALEESIKNDPYASGIQALLAQGLPGIHGPVGHLLESSSIHKELVRAALGDRINYFIAETQSHAENAIAHLMKQKKGRARFVVLERLPSDLHAQPLAFLKGERSLLELVHYDPFFERAMRFLASDVWVSGSVFYEEGVVSGGVDPSEWQDPTDITATRKTLDAERTQVANVMSKADDHIASLQQEIARKNEGREILSAKLSEIQVSQRFLEKLRGDSSESLKVIEEELDAIQGQIAQSQNLLQETETHIQENENQLKEYDREEAELKSRHEELKETIASLEARCNQDTNDLATRKGEMKAREDVVQMAEQNWSQNQTSIAHLRSSLKASEDELQQSAANREAAIATQKEMTEKLHELAATLMNHEEGLRRIQNERNEIQKAVDEQETNLESLRQELLSAQETFGNERMSRSQEQSRLEGIIQKIQDDHQLTLEAALQSHAPNPCDPQELDKRRRRLLSIGPVNLAAPEEHAQLQSRYDFLMTQQQDLLKAKGDLMEVITKINATTKESFRETFEKVRENFRTIYAQLFSGGEADLRLTDDGDPLNAGVDIFAQPPGKKLQHISLLSGGEKALTANALLFAFFQTRPSPMALLDEVDAPLDEANVVRFTSLLKNYANRTQFIIISHNKRTMEIADSLYGVTMEEQGVSKVLSAKLTKKNPVEPVAAAR